MIEILQQIINGMAIGGVYVLIALGLTTVFGILGIAHFAHGSVSMFGGYLTFFLVVMWGLPLLAAILIALVVGLILGVLIELLAYRPVRNASHINAFIVALGLTMMVEGLNLEFFGHEQVVIPTNLSHVYNIGGVTIPERATLRNLGRCSVDRRYDHFRRENQDRASSIRAEWTFPENTFHDAAILIGVNVNTIPLVVFSISTALGVCAGVMVGATYVCRFDRRA